jgi:hypothetical protein
MPGDAKHLKEYQFKPGQSGNPNGCPKGVKQLREAALEGFFKAWEEIGGEKGLINWIKQHPSHRAKFYSWLVPLFPKETKIEGGGIGNYLQIFEGLDRRGIESIRTLIREEIGRREPVQPD